MDNFIIILFLYFLQHFYSSYDDVKLLILNQLILKI